MSAAVYRSRILSDRIVRGVALLVVAFGVLLELGAGVAAAAELQSEEVVARTKSATLQAQIDPQAHDTTCQAQYVSEETYKDTGWNGRPSVPCSPENLGSGSSPVATTVALDGLKLSTTYHYRFLLTSEGNTVSGAEESFATFGVEAFSFESLGPGTSFGPLMEPVGVESFTTAGGHPFELYTYIAAASTKYEGKGGDSPDAIVKDVLTELPSGLVGNPDAMPRCPVRVAEETRCPAASEVGTITVWQGVKNQSNSNPAPIFDVIPPEGVAASFASEINISLDAFIDASVRSGGDYGITAGGHNITANTNITKFQIVLWGVPNSPSHNAERYCLKPSGQGYSEKSGCAPEGPERPFLTLGSDCHQSQAVTASLTSYAEPDEAPVTKTATMPDVTGCATMPFEPSIEASPTTVAGDSPTGLNVGVRIPQNEKPEGQASADLKDAAVTFPPGLTVDPSQAEGLEACSEEQVGFIGFKELDPTSEHGVETAQFKPGKAECPPASKLGKVEVKTPLLDHPLVGGLYLARQKENPFGSLLAVYLTVYDEVSGVVLKLPGKVEANPVTGQLSTTFEQNPQLPFEELRVELPEGPRAALTTPLTCGSYATSTELVPWSAPEGKTEDPVSPAFPIAEAPGGGSCAGSESGAPNKPAFEAGTASPIAGSYSPFVLNLSREDGSQRFSALNVTLPPGLVGKVAGIEQCPQGDIEQAQKRGGEGEGALEQSNPSCPSGSEVGTVHVGAGSGAPYFVTGKAYFAGPYNGAPFSLVIVTPAIAGPFDLGTVVVRAGLFINSSTAQVTVKSDPFPTILDGIPLDIRTIQVDISRNDFTLNPTSCNAMTLTGEAQSTTGNIASLSDPFKAEGCGNLPFHPSFTASTQGSTSKAGGASLTVKVVPAAGQANIAKVDLTLPKQLPARLTTLQKACTEAQFNANPAGCPEASFIGTAIAHTPILANPLVGPAILVSHGGAAFPDVEFILQGEGVKIVLDGNTQIKNGITYSKFETVPDAPISSFETVLPEGPHSVLGTDLPASAKYSLCGQSLTMPTTITGQNGVVVNQTTKIAVTGCKAVKAKPLTRAQKLKAALKVCRTKDRGSSRAKRRKRAICEQVAQRRYGPVKKAKSERKGGKKK